MVQIEPEATLLDLGLERAVGGREEADVGADLVVAAHAAERVALEHAQELRLQLERELADLVEEERPARGELDEAALHPARAGEGARRVAEELALEQRGREARRVDGDERALRALAPAVEQRGGELLPVPDSPVSRTWVRGARAAASSTASASRHAGDWPSAARPSPAPRRAASSRSRSACRSLACSSATRISSELAGLVR